MTHEHKKIVMSTADTFAKIMAILTDEDFRQWIGYFLEAVEGECIERYGDTIGKESMQDVYEVITSRIEKGRW